MDIDEITDPLDIARFCGDPNWTPYLCVDWEHGTIEIESRHESQNGTSFHEWHGHSDSWKLPLVDAEQIRDAVEGCLPVIQAAAEQYYSDWDGNNHIAKFRDEVEHEDDTPWGEADPDYGARRAAQRKIELALAYLEHAGSAWFWDAGDWFQYSDPVAKEYGITPLSTDADLDAIAEKMVKSSAEHGYYNVILEVSDCRSYAEQVRDDLLEDEDVLDEIWASLPGPTLSRVDDDGDTIYARRAGDNYLALDSYNDAIEIAYDLGNGIDGQTDWVVAKLGPYTRIFQGEAL